MLSRIGFLLWLFAVAVPGATITATIVGTTNTQATLSWSNSDAACTVEVSESATYLPLVNDVNPALFANSNLSNRPEAIVSGNNHVFPVGKRLVETTITAVNRSRSLQTNTVHYYRISCNSGADAGTGTFTTANIPFGMTWADEFQLSAPDAIVYPTVTANSRTQVLIDSRTGLLMHPLTIANDVTVSPNNPRGVSLGGAEFCSGNLDSHGNYKCLLANDYAPYVYAINLTTGVAVFIGTVNFYGQGYGFESGVTGGKCLNTDQTNSAMWDESDPNVLYCAPNDGTTSGLSLAKLTFDGNDTPVTGGSGPIGPPEAVFTVTNLTPYPNTLYAKLQTFNSDLTWACAATGYMAGYLHVSCRVGIQDTYAWEGAYNLGNKLPLGSGGTGSVTALIKPWELTASRWCTDHTAETFIGQIALSSFSFQTAKGAHGAGVGQSPHETTLLTTLSASGTPGFTTVAIQVSSAWDGGWGSTPAGFFPGYPVAYDAPHFLMPPAVGDWVSFTNGNIVEYMEITAITDPTHWTVIRGVNGTIETHAINDTIKTRCHMVGSDPDFHGYMWWKFAVTPDASANYGANFGDHPVLRAHDRADSYPFRIADPMDTGTWGVSNATTISENLTFAGGLALESGNLFQAHIAEASSGPGWGVDVKPFVGGNGVTQQNSSAVTPKTGSLYQYHYNGDNVTGYFPKQLSHFALNGNHALLDISGPGVTLPSNSLGNYQYCVANAANECYSGSSIGDIFFNVPTLDVQYCNDSVSVALNICIGNMPALGFAVPQAQWIDTTPGKAFRVLTRMMTAPKDSQTNNVKILYDGSWMMYNVRTNPPQDGWYLAKIPPIPASDGVDRTTFVPASLALTAPVGLGVTTAKVYFGYTEQGTQAQYYCTSRREPCVAAAGTVNPANPFYYATTDTFSPVSCAVTCTIALPVLPMHTAYFRVSYLNGGGSQVASESGVAVESSYVLNGAVAGGTVSNPDLSPLGGTFSVAQSVTMTTSTALAAIHYTSDGSTPTCASTVYTTAISVPVTVTLKAIGCKTGMTDSGVTSQTYTIVPSNTSTVTRKPGGARIGVIGR